MSDGTDKPINCWKRYKLYTNWFYWYRLSTPEKELCIQTPFGLFIKFK